MVLFFFVKQKTAYEVRISDWSSDVCSSDLFGEDRGVGDEQIVADQLHLVAKLLGQVFPAFPVAFRTTVIDRDHRILSADTGKVVGKLFAGVALAFTMQVVLALGVELVRRDVEAELDVLAWLEAGLLDSLKQTSEEHQSELKSQM